MHFDLWYFLAGAALGFLSVWYKPTKRTGPKLRTEEIDHYWAMNHARVTAETSNLARAYIELRQLAASMWEGPISDEEEERLKAIIHSNDS